MISQDIPQQNRKRTTFVKSLFSIFVLAWAFNGFAQEYTPVTLDGFNEDVIANGIGDATTSITKDVDGVNFALVAEDFQATESSSTPVKFLPTGGVMTTGNKAFQLADYDQNNSLRLEGSNKTGVLTFTTPIAVQNLYVLGISGSGVSDVTATVNFTDGTSQVFAGLVYADWFNNNSDVVFSGVGRVNLNNNGLESGDGPRLTEQILTIATANSFKEVESVTFTTGNTNGVMNVLAISATETPETTACDGTPDAGTASVLDTEICENIAFSITVTGATEPAPGLTFQWQTSPAGENNWADVVGGTEVNLTITNGISEATDYRLVVNCDGEEAISNIVSMTVKNANDCYCIPVGTDPNRYINSFSTTGGFENITNNNSGFAPNGYGIHTEMIVSQNFGEQVNFSASISGGTAGFKIWIDWNQDGQFTSDEIAYNSTGYSSEHIGMFEVPTTALAGATRMRIGSDYYTMGGPVDPCDTQHDEGEFEDYTFIVTTATRDPVDGLVLLDVTATTATIEWNGTNPEPANGYEYYYNTTGTAPNAGTAPSGTTTETIVHLTDLPTGEYYFWVRAVCSDDDASSWMQPLEFGNVYCTPVYTSGDYTRRFSTSGALQDIELTYTSVYNFSDVTETVTLVQYAGGTFDFEHIYVGGSNTVTIWVDWGNDFAFGPEDVIYTALSSELSSNGSITIPSDIAPGTYRVRLRSKYSGGTIDPCGSETYGSAIDFMLEVQEAPSCFPPQNIIFSDITDNSITVEWDEANAANQWEISYLADGEENPTVIVVTENPYTVEGLEDNTNYTIQVRTICGEEDNSYWTAATVRTSCVAIAIPYLETFENDSENLDCWDNETEEGQAEWLIETGAGWAVPNAYEGTYNASFEGSSIGSNNSLISPRFDVSGNDSIVVTYAYVLEGDDFYGDLDELTVFGKTETDADWIELKNYTNSAEDWTLDTIIIVREDDQFNGDFLTLSFKAVYGWGYGTGIDNVFIQPCAITPSIDGSVDVCRIEGVFDLNTAITLGEDWGRWVFEVNQSLVEGSMLNIESLPAGTYEALYIVESPCTADTAVATIQIFPPSSAGHGGTISVCKNQPLDLHSGLSGSVDLGGDWYDYNGNLLPNSQPSAPNFGGSYNYTYVTSNNVCAGDTASIQVIVNGDCDYLSIAEEAFEGMSVYPNPTSDVINIVNPMIAKALKIELIDMNGRIVATDNNALQNASQATLNIDHIQNGIYTLRIYNEEGQKAFKIVKQ